MKEGTQSQREVAEFFNVSLSFVESLLQYYLRSGEELVRPLPRRRRHLLLGDFCRERLRHWLEEQPDLTLKELVQRLHGSTGMTVSEPTMRRVLHRMDLRRKKTVHATERDSACVRMARRR